MCALLKKGGFEVTSPFAGYDTAYQAVFHNGEGPKIAFLAEYDALPGVGHGCGHNFHGSLSILAGLAMVELKSFWKGTLEVIGTPAEESEGGKVGMAQNGAFDGLDLAAMLHTGVGGVSYAAQDGLSLREYLVEFTGKSAHAAGTPWLGRSALAAARKFVDLVDARRECFPIPRSVFSSIFKDGGQAPNVIPAHASVIAEFRSTSLKNLERLNEMVIKCAEGAAPALECEVSWKKQGLDYSDMVLVKPLQEELLKQFQEHGFKVEPMKPSSGSSDVGNVSYVCPTIQGCINISDHAIANHSKEVADLTVQPASFEIMARGAQVLIGLGLRTLNDPAFLQSVKTAFAKALAEKKE
jgi:amidohydrolase